MLFSSATLMAQAEARWAEIVAEHPELEAAARLQRGLLAHILEATAALARLDLPKLPAAPAAMLSKLPLGLPALRGDDVVIPELLARAGFIEAICEKLAAGGAGDVARHVAEVMASGRIDRKSLLSASLTRDEQAIRMTSIHLGLAPDLVWLVGELAAAGRSNALAPVSGSRSTAGTRDDRIV
jgi:hypothetical protein